MVVVVETSRREINASNIVFGQVFDVDRKLQRTGLLLAHSMRESGLAILTLRWNDEQIGLSRSDDPFAVDAHVNGPDRVTETWEESLGILPNL